MAGSGIGIDAGARTVKLVQGREKGGQFQLQSVALHERRPDAEGRPSDAVEDAIAEVIGSGVAKKAPTVLGLTGRDLMLRYSQAPILPVQRLKVLLDFEVQEIAEKIEGEISADYNLLPGEIGDGGEQMVLIAMAKDSYLESRVDACASSLPVRYATPNMLAAFNAFLRFGSFAEGETTLHLDIGQEGSDLAIQRDGDLLFARNLNFGGSNFTEALASQFGLDPAKAEELKLSKGRIPVRGESFDDGLTEKAARVLQGVLGQVVGLVQSSVSFCKVQWKRQDLKVERVILSGGGSLLPGLPKAMSESLGMPVELFDPVDRLDLSALDPDSEKLLRKRPQLFAVPLGLALMASDSRFFSVQVLPARLRKRKALLERTSFLVAAGVLGVVYLALSIVLGSKSLRAAEDRHENLSQQESQRRRDESKYEDYLAETREKLARLDLLESQLAPGFAFARTAEAVQRVMDGVVEGEDGGFDELWIESAEIVERKKTKQDQPPPVIVLRGSGIETDEDVSRVANRFAAALERELAASHGADAKSSFNRRDNTFEIEIDFRPPVSGEGEGERDED